MEETGTYFADVSRIGKIRLSGKSSPEFVNVMTTVEHWRLETPGQAAIALVLNAEGEIIDLVMIGRTGEHEYILITSPETVCELTEWLEAHAGLANSEGAAVFEDIKVEDRTDRIGAFALYGPDAQMILDEMSKSDVSAELGEKNLTLVSIGRLQVMILRWPLLRSHGQDMPLKAEGEVFEVYLPAKATDDFKKILLSFAEIDPEDYGEYFARRRRAHTCFDAAEQDVYIRPETAGLKALLRSDADFVGARALRKLGILSH
ncbi:MAG: hypothetical protein LBJ48_00365 [Coriobacteriales bacterium]|jgi:glycine cleavage system aminomethyltransferase T|nr:hypothetical protein [Coriobacteriales bacterium]